MSDHVKKKLLKKFSEIFFRNGIGYYISLMLFWGEFTSPLNVMRKNMELAGYKSISKCFAIAFAISFLIIRTAIAPVIIFGIHYSEVNIWFKIIIGGGFFVSLIWIWQILNMLVKELKDVACCGGCYKCLKGFRKYGWALNIFFCYFSFRWIILKELGIKVWYL